MGESQRRKKPIILRVGSHSAIMGLPVLGMGMKDGHLLVQGPVVTVRGGQSGENKNFLNLFMCLHVCPHVCAPLE